MKEPIRSMDWLDRQFTFDLPLAWFPAVVERLRGTPARVASLVAGIPDPVLSERSEGKWSVKDHVGHFSDLCALDRARLWEFVSGARVLSGADMENRRTHLANHHLRPVYELIREFQTLRFDLVGSLEELSQEQVATRAYHPRIQALMRLIDWAYFVAEHDDHHLARIHELLKESERSALR